MKILGRLDQTGVGSVQEKQEIWWEAPRGPAVRRAHNSAPAAVSRAPSANGTALQGLRFSLWEWVWLLVLPFFCPCGRGFSSDSYTLARWEISASPFPVDAG